MSTIKRLNKLVKEIMGKPMTKEQKEFQEILRAKVRNKEITVKEGHKVWNKKYRDKEA
mgnify:FL=1